MVERVQVNPTAPEPHLVGLAVAAIRSGGLVAYPTDTLYGLGADPMNPEAVSRLRRVKGGTDRQGIPLIAADLEQVLACTVDTSGRVRRLADRWWPGPLTLVVHATVAFADGVRAHDGSVAIRVPAHDVARSIAEGVGGPITSTSANRSGELAPMDASAIVAELVSTLAMVVDAGATAGGQPSTIVDVRGLELRLVRPGRVPWNRVLESAES